MRTRGGLRFQRYGEIELNHDDTRLPGSIMRLTATRVPRICSPRSNRNLVAFSAVDWRFVLSEAKLCKSESMTLVRLDRTVGRRLLDRKKNAKQRAAITCRATVEGEVYTFRHGQTLLLSESGNVSQQPGCGTSH